MLVCLQAENELRRTAGLRQNSETSLGEVALIRAISKRHAMDSLASNNKYLVEFFNALQCKMDKNQGIGAIIARATNILPLPFICDMKTGDSPLHIVLESNHSPEDMLRLSKLLLKCDRNAGKSRNDRRLLPLHVLCKNVERKSLNSRQNPTQSNGELSFFEIKYISVFKAVVDSYPEAVYFACDGGRYPIDFVSSIELKRLLTSRVLTSHQMARSIFDVVRSKPLPMLTLRRLMKDNPFAAMDEEDGYWPLEALCAFGAPNPEAIKLLYTANPIALYRPVGPSCLGLLCGSSSSIPSLVCVKLLCILHPAAAVHADNSVQVKKILPSKLLQERARMMRKKERAKDEDHAAIMNFLVKLEDVFQAWRIATDKEIPDVFRLIKSLTTNFNSEYLRLAVNSEISKREYSKDRRNSSILHILCQQVYNEEGGNAHDSTLFQDEQASAIINLVTRKRQEFLRQNTCGKTPFELLFTKGRPSVKLVKFLTCQFPELVPQMQVMIRSLHLETHPDYPDLLEVVHEDSLTSKDEEIESLKQSDISFRKSAGWEENVTKAALHQKKALSWRIKYDLALAKSHNFAAVLVQRAWRSWHAWRKINRRRTRDNAAIEIQKVWRSHWQRKKIVRPSKQKIVHGLRHAILEYRRQVMKAVWLRSSLELNSDLYSAITSFIRTLRIRYRVGIGSWMQGRVKGTISNPQRLVAALLHNLIDSSKLLEAHEVDYNSVMEYRAGAAAREKKAQRREAIERMYAAQESFRQERERKRRALEAELERIAAEKERVRRVEAAKVLQVQMAQREAAEEALALAHAAEIARVELATREKFAAEHKGDDLRDFWQFRGRGLEDLCEEDTAILQEIEDDLASLAEMEEDWNDNFWDLALIHEETSQIADSKEADLRKLREFTVKFEHPPIGIKLVGRGSKLIVQGFQFQDKVEAMRFEEFKESVELYFQSSANLESRNEQVTLPIWPQYMRRICQGDELVGVGEFLFPETMNHNERMGHIVNAQFPLELNFRKSWN